MDKVLNIDEIKKLIAQFSYTLRDERFESNQSTIGQLLPNTNETLQHRYSKIDGANSCN